MSVLIGIVGFPGPVGTIDLVSAFCLQRWGRRAGARRRKGPLGPSLAPWVQGGVPEGQGIRQIVLHCLGWRSTSPWLSAMALLCKAVQAHSDRPLPGRHPAAHGQHEPLLRKLHTEHSHLILSRLKLQGPHSPGRKTSDLLPRSRDTLFFCSVSFH